MFHVAVLFFSLTQHMAHEKTQRAGKKVGDIECYFGCCGVIWGPRGVQKWRKMVSAWVFSKASWGEGGGPNISFRANTLTPTRRIFSTECTQLEDLRRPHTRQPRPLSAWCSNLPRTARLFPSLWKNFFAFGFVAPFSQSLFLPQPRFFGAFLLAIGDLELKKCIVFLPRKIL